MMDQVIIYIHGKGGNADGAKHYESLFENRKVIRNRLQIRNAVGSSGRIP